MEEGGRKSCGGDPDEGSAGINNNKGETVVQATAEEKEQQAPTMARPKLSGAGIAHEASNSVSSANSSSSDILERILQQKMALATAASSSLGGGGGISPAHFFVRANSVDSVCSVTSASTSATASGVGGVGGGDDRCRCDDCILGITDLLAEQEAARLKTIRDEEEAAAAATDATGGGAAATAAAVTPAAGAASPSSSSTTRPLPTRRKVRTEEKILPLTSQFSDEREEGGTVEREREKGVILFPL